MDSNVFRVSPDHNATPRKSDRSPFEWMLDGIAEQTPPPCVGCPLSERCAERELACEQYFAYVHYTDGREWPYPSPPTREPNRALFRAAMQTDGEERMPELRRRGKIRRTLRGNWANPETVRFVRASGESPREIARMARLSVHQVRRIRRGDAYQDVA